MIENTREAIVAIVGIAAFLALVFSIQECGLEVQRLNMCEQKPETCEYVLEAP